MERKNYKTLNLSDKIKMIGEVENGVQKKKDIAATFGIPANILTTIVKNKEKIFSTFEDSAFQPGRKRMKLLSFPDVEKAMVEWLKSAREKNIPISGVLYHMEDELLYYPEIPRHSRVYVPAPSTCNLPYQSLFIRSKDGTMLHMFFIPQPEDKIKKAPTVLFLHGNAGNMGHRLQNVVGLYENLQCNILMLEYRGFGLSQGSPSEEGLYMDARAGIEYLATRSDININEIIVFGRSLGGAVAIDLASEEEYAQRINFLILENTFTSIPDMSAVLIGSKLRYLPLIFYKNKYLSLQKIRSLTVPTLFISGLADKLVPSEMMTELYKACRSSCKKIIPIPAGSHNETWRRPDYYQHILSFIQELNEKPPIRNTSTHWQIDEI